jgi:hypothetical protein
MPSVVPKLGYDPIKDVQAVGHCPDRC